ncbi:MAG: porphobilinogen synthase [Candidatus Adiutrix intracellularis]|nr:porphobilinogen synthase [Candidatus Adiutrix intracellularis]
MTIESIRPRRLRGHAGLRRMLQETILTPTDFIYPLFIIPGSGLKKPIPSLTEQYHFSPDEAAAEAAALYTLGIPAVLLFGLPAAKDPIGSSGADPAGPVPSAVRAIKKAVPNLVVATDICLCEYTDHGHCGLIKNGRVDNNATLPYLARQALVHAEAGADLLAPSDMMDGRVRVIRTLLDQEGFDHLPIMAYSVKYASAFYDTFREAVASTPAFGDRKSYQEDPTRRREALIEVELDRAEGADIVMVKPAGPYLDIIRQIRDRFDLPLAAYQVSGEYTMLTAAARAGLLDERAAALESLIAIKRAGADIIITYLAPKVAQWLRKG